MKKDSIDWYITKRPIYKRLSSKIESILIELFDSKGISYHMVTSRAKDIDSFRIKIASGKYDNPETEIQDFAGIRIITYVEDEISEICDLIESSFKIDKTNSSDKSDNLGIDKVGYKSVHYIAYLKNDRLKLPEYQQFKGLCFEIQVRTILQHAWAEIEHDRNYKFRGKLPDEISRRFKLLAGALEMADREFNNIAKEIDEISKDIQEETEKGNLNIPLNSTSLSQFLKTRFKDLLEKGIEIDPNGDEKLLNEMKAYGLNSLDDFNKIIPKDFSEVTLAIADKDESTKYQTEFGIVRKIMIVNDYKKYFEDSFDNSFGVWSIQNRDREFFEHYDINWDKDIQKVYNVPYS